MHINTFDHYQRHQSWVHRLDPRVKVISAVAFIVANALLPDGAWLAFMLAWLLVVVLAISAEIPPWFVVKRSLLALPFMLAAVTVIFTIPGDVVWQGPLGLTATDAGLERFFSILMRSWVSVQMAILLMATTPFPDVLHALRHLKVPAILVSIIAFMYRYIFVLADEVGRLLRGRAARSARLPNMAGHGGTLRWRAGVAGSMVGQLFLRSFERSDRVYNAMLARGYRGELLTINPDVMRGSDWVGVGSFALILLLLQAVGRFL